MRRTRKTTAYSHHLLPPPCPAPTDFHRSVMALDHSVAFIHIHPGVFPQVLKCRDSSWWSAETCPVTGPVGWLWGHWRWGHRGVVHTNSAGPHGRRGWPGWEQGWHGSRAVPAGAGAASATQAEAPALPPGSAAPRRLPAPHRNRQLESKQCLKPILIRLIYE